MTTNVTNYNQIKTA